MPASARIQRDQRAGRRRRVRHELERDVVGEASGHDPRADHGHHQQAGPQRFADQSTRKVGVRGAGARLRLSAQIDHATQQQFDVVSWTASIRAGVDVLDSSEAEILARAFAALSDPIRLRMMSAIAAQGGDEVCACDLV